MENRSFITMSNRGEPKPILASRGKLPCESLKKKSRSTDGGIDFRFKVIAKVFVTNGRAASGADKDQRSAEAGCLQREWPRGVRAPVERFGRADGAFHRRIVVVSIIPGGHETFEFVHGRIGIQSSRSGRGCLKFRDKRLDFSPFPGGDPHFDQLAVRVVETRNFIRIEHETLRNSL